MTFEKSTSQQVAELMHKLAKRYPATDEPSVFTDIHLRLSQETGELIIVNDEDIELARTVVEPWIDCKDEQFYDEVAAWLRSLLRENAAVCDNLGLTKPYSFTLEDEDGEHLAELYIADDDMTILGGDLMKGIDEELDAFFEHLLKE